LQKGLLTDLLIFGKSFFCLSGKRIRFLLLNDFKRILKNSLAGALQPGQ
jgi:hypothetical protein